MMKQDKEGMGSTGDAITTTTTIITGTTDRMRPQKRRGTGSMLSLVGNTKDNIFGASVNSTSMVTIETTITMEEIRVTKETTEEIRAIQMQAITAGSLQDCTMWMNTGT